jgi:hypothetical protein
LKNQRTLYISDLDGTLLGDDATLSEYSSTALKRLLSNGTLFTVASARSVISMQHILKGLPIGLPVIEFNGGFLSDFETGRHYVINSLEPHVVEKLHELISGFGFSPFVSTFNGSEDCLYYGDIVNEGMQWYLEDRTRNRDKRLRAIGKLADSFKDHVISITVVGLGETVGELRRSIVGDFGDHVQTNFFENRYSPGWHWLTIQSDRTTKDQAIHILKKDWDLDDAELVVFGDSSNDIRMFQMADRAIAVANASEDLLEYATETIGPSNEDSVVKFMERELGLL